MTFENPGNLSEIGHEAEARPRLVEGGKGLVVDRIGKSYNKRPVGAFGEPVAAPGSGVRRWACSDPMARARPPAST